MAKTTAKAGIIKKKRWVQIVAPPLFNSQVLGESYVGEPEELVGRKVSVSLMTLTGDPHKQNTAVSFIITGVDNGRVVSEMVGYKLSPAAVKRLMRRRKSKVDDSFIVQTADKKAVRIKAVIVTRSRTTNSVLTAINKLERAYVAKAVSQLSFDDLIREVVGKKVQHGLSQLLKRLHPVGVCEIRHIEFIPAEKVKELGLKVLLPPEKLPEVPKREKKESEIVEESAPESAEQSA